MKRVIREVAPTFTQEQADDFIPNISPEALPYILSSVVSADGPSGSIRKYPIHILDGTPEVYQGAYIYPYWGMETMYAHVEVVFDEVPLPHESVLKWCALSMKAGPVSSKARANQLVVVQGNHLHYLWRVLSIESERTILNTRSLDISNLHLWRWIMGAPGVCCVDQGKWVCGRTSLDSNWVLTTPRSVTNIDPQTFAFIPDGESIHKLYMALLGSNLL